MSSNARNPGLGDARAIGDETLETLSQEDIHQDILSWPNQSGNEIAFLTQLAIEQDVDAIFFISGYHRGFHKVRRRLSAKEEADW